MGKRRLWLCVAPVAFCLLDAALTLIGQPATYWAGNYDYVEELSPLSNWLLRQHPMAFGAGIAGWVLVFSITLVSVPRRPAQAASVFIVLGHTFGAGTWLCDRILAGVWFLPLLWLVSAAALVVTWEKAGVIEPPEGRA